MTPILFQPDLLGVLTFAVSILLPILVGLVTTKVTNSGLKAILLAAAALITSVLTAWISAIQHHEPFDLYQSLLTFGGVFLVAVAAHFGFWKPTGVSEKAQAAFSRKPGDHVAGTEPTGPADV